jgi:hypothetical protein
LRCPVVAIVPRDTWLKAAVSRRSMVATMFLASARACATANCAVGGANCSVAPLRTSAQSPIAQTRGMPGIDMSGRVSMRPRCFGQRSCATSGLGRVPMVEITVEPEMTSPFVNVTPRASTLAARAFSRTSMWRDRSERDAASPSDSGISSSSRSASCSSVTFNSRARTRG